MEKVKKSYRTFWAVFFIVAPFVLLPVILVVYAIFSFVFATLGWSEMANATMILSLIHVGLSLLAIVAILGMFVGVPVGIYLLVTADKKPNEEKPATPPAAPPSDNPSIQ